MTAPVTFSLHSPRERGRAMEFLRNAPTDAYVAFSRPKRTGAQNAKLHAMITDVAGQVEWAGAKRDVEAWKDIFTAALRSAKHGLDVVPGINGGFVLLGMHTSAMTKAEVADLIELIHAFGAEHGVRFHDDREPEALPAPFVDGEFKVVDDGQGAGGAKNPARVAA
jgi:hypothetical protein